jgi:hypothetical protein
LTKKFDRLFQTRPVDADLQPAEKSEPILQADEGSAVEPEQIVDKITEVALPERPSEAVRHSECASVQRHTHRRGKDVDRVIRLRRQNPPILIRLILLCAGRGRDCNRHDKNAQQKR